MKSGRFLLHFAGGLTLVAVGWWLSGYFASLMGSVPVAAIVGALFGGLTFFEKPNTKYLVEQNAIIENVKRHPMWPYVTCFLLIVAVLVWNLYASVIMHGDATGAYFAGLLLAITAIFTARFLRFRAGAFQ